MPHGAITIISLFYFLFYLSTNLVTMYVINTHSRVGEIADGLSRFSRKTHTSRSEHELNYGNLAQTSVIAIGYI
jgi:hypothetical protein